MKRDELHSLGINMATGQIVEGFYDRVRKRRLTPQIPPTIHLQHATLSLNRAVAELEKFLEAKVSTYDQTWSVDAWKRLKEEWSRIDSYYGDLLQSVEPSQKTEVEEQYKAREQEIDWQYRPRIAVSVTNCGFFHLYEGMRTPIDPSR
ncbi:Bacterial protein YqhG [compost metagenome]